MYATKEKKLTLYLASQDVRTYRTSYDLSKNTLQKDKFLDIVKDADIVHTKSASPVNNNWK